MAEWSGKGSGEARFVQHPKLLQRCPSCFPFTRLQKLEKKKIIISWHETKDANSHLTVGNNGHHYEARLLSRPNTEQVKELPEGEGKGEKKTNKAQSSQGQPKQTASKENMLGTFAPHQGKGGTPTLLIRCQLPVAGICARPSELTP